MFYLAGNRAGVFAAPLRRRYRKDGCMYQSEWHVARPGRKQQ
jgi:hypothetical protein